MKRLIYFGMGLALCLSAAVLTGCDENNKDKDETTEPVPVPVPAPEIAMVYVEGGTFTMGLTPEQGRIQDSYDKFLKPVHRVTLDGFYIGKYEVTQAQWTAVMGTSVVQQRDSTDPDRGLYGVGDNYPMYYVNWDEAQAFCQKLSEMTGKTYRLPTEAEWEYAARGGHKADSTKYAGSDSVDAVSWYYNNSYELGEQHPDYGTHTVGLKQPNGLGLYDMGGNVWEWCSDWYSDDYYAQSPSANPQGPSDGTFRVCRGGSWNFHKASCQVAFRSSGTPSGRGAIMGFRVVCEK